MTENIPGKIPLPGEPEHNEEVAREIHDQAQREGPPVIDDAEKGLLEVYKQVEEVTNTKIVED